MAWSNQAPPPQIGNWTLQQKLGSGFSGSIWSAYNPYIRQFAALKLQDVSADIPTNKYERNFYPSLQGGVGMPRLWASGVHHPYDYLVIDLLGVSLDNLYRQNGKQTMDLMSVICIAMQVISRLEWMHSRGILHRDIQLGNCVIGRSPSETTIYMIDFGFSKRYIDQATKRHIPDSKVKRDFIGNYWFTSVNVHCRGKVPSRRDDLEALALMLIHLLIPGGLPWTRNGVPKTDAQGDRIIKEKRDATPDELCRGLPEVFEEFLRYCRRLRFAELPDYKTWRDKFAELAEDNGWVNEQGVVDDAFIWPASNRKVVVAPKTIPRPPPTPLRDSTNVLKALGDLAKLRLDDHQVPGAKKPTHPEANTPQTEAKPQSKSQDAKAIVVESDDEDVKPNNTRTAKSLAIRKLTAKMGIAPDNKTVGNITNEFLSLLLSNRSKTMTIEGFAFLAALQKQLRDPSVFIAKSRESSRPSRTRSQSGQKQNPSFPSARIDMRALYASIVRAPKHSLQNSDLGQMVSEFDTIVRKAPGKTVSKDGLGFLECVVERLEG